PPQWLTIGNSSGDSEKRQDSYVWLGLFGFERFSLHALGASPAALCERRPGTSAASTCGVAQLTPAASGRESACDSGSEDREYASGERTDLLPADGKLSQADAAGRLTLADAPTSRSETVPIHDPSDRDRAAVDPKHRALATALLDGRLRAFTADGDVAVDGDVFGVGP